jgi:hypothetical protein
VANLRAFSRDKKALLIVFAAVVESETKSLQIILVCTYVPRNKMALAAVGIASATGTEDTGSYPARFQGF